MRFAQEISIFNPHAIEMAVVALGTQITQTAEEIRLEAAQTLSNYSTTVQMNAAISTKANEITSEVSQTYATQQSVNNSVSSLSSRITQNASSISSEVTARGNADSALSSRIQQTLKSITFNITNNSTNTAATLSMSVTNEGGSTTALTSKSINLTGLVTFTNLSTSGQTTINGSNITTGSIKDANSNTVFNLTDGTLTMKKGSINLGNGTFSVTNAGKLTASDIFINAPLGSTGSRVYAYDIGGTRLNMGEGTLSNATFFVDITQDRVRTRPVYFIDRTGGLKGGIEIDGDGDGNSSYKRLRMTNGLKVGSDGGEWFISGAYAWFKGGWSDSSDRRVKQDIEPLVVEDSVHTIMNLKPVSFAYKSDPEHIQHGFIAQDVREIVHGWDVVRESESGILGLSYTDFIADLVATVQYQNKRIEALERCTASIS